MPVNPSGGMIGCGHVAGCSGISRVGEIVQQLRGRAGGTQVPINQGRAIFSAIGGPGISAELHHRIGEIMNETDIFEVELEDVYRYRLPQLRRAIRLFPRTAEQDADRQPLFRLRLRVAAVAPDLLKCYAPASEYPLSGKGEVITTIVLPQAPAHLAHLDAVIATALVRPDGADMH